ncbi:exodeoxyribonuclease V subunit gamma [Psychrobacter sp. I-STPA10]|uniref:exodeoxyribonuclease V subunit gamma n=1 Tax=Psychrobacter sp. I-STPA10 TaxID=2585769 RepID=UPI001E3ADD4B|nr:exodeoxyribonuclease V subunit gamma [Psychrobacter sp. I-STPA10]
MLTIIQSHRTERLVDFILRAYQAPNQSVFEQFIVIVPSMVLGDWLQKRVAEEAGISTLITTTFWGKYQWQLMQDILAQYNQWIQSSGSNEAALQVPEVAVLSPTVMQWRLFGYLTQATDSLLTTAKSAFANAPSYFVAQQQLSQVKNDDEVLQPLLQGLLGSLLSLAALPSSASTASQQDIYNQIDQRLWQLAGDLARVFNRYLTHRDEWLINWDEGKKIDVAAMVAQKDKLSTSFDQFAHITPSWLLEHYEMLEQVQRHLWQRLFSDVHRHRQRIEARFWQALAIEASGCQPLLPNRLTLFTIQQLPQAELDFIEKLSKYVDITLLHYNPSQLFWADIVDKQWLLRQRIINPDSVFLRDYGHTLLSQLGKQSREVFAMLASLSGNEDYADERVQWIDAFDLDFNTDVATSQNNDIEPSKNLALEPSLLPSLLQRLQYDVLMLSEDNTRQKAVQLVSEQLQQQLELPFAETQTTSDDLDDDAHDASLSMQRIEQKRFDKQRQWQLRSSDNSISIHSCHSLQRQLEVLRGMIGRWLNESSQDGSIRHVSDIVIMLPDVERHYELIKSVFVDGRGQDGLILPAKITGVVDKSIRELWHAIIGFYQLLGRTDSRFEAHEVFDWLMLPALYESFGLTHEQMSRACTLLAQAGYIRGFDESHLQSSLHRQDSDYRFSFAYALDRLVTGMLMPQALMTDCLYLFAWQSEQLKEKTLPLHNIMLSDAPIIEVLCQIYQGIDQNRECYQQRRTAQEWIAELENKVIHRYFAYFDQTQSMRAIFSAMNGFRASLRANRHYQQYGELGQNNPTTEATSKMVANLAAIEQMPLKLAFMLDSIEAQLESQQVSAEPTGVITFGRFGSLRNIPFKLVAMLNMNLSEFPNRDHDNRYDLMRAGLAKRGDRFTEDDDNGAFLDALLCARDDCWIFYNGQSLSDSHEHLPANPVSELLQFLQQQVDWQLPNLQPNLQQDTANAEQLDDSGKLQRYLPRLVERWLVTVHPALPFAKDNFIYHTPSATPVHTEQQCEDKADITQLADQLLQQSKVQQKKHFPPAPLWQSVFQTLRARHDIHNNGDTDTNILNTHLINSLSKIILPNKTQYQDIAKLLKSSHKQIKQLANNDASLHSHLHSIWQQTQTLISQLLPSKTAMDSTVTESEETKVASLILTNKPIALSMLVHQVRAPAQHYLRQQQLNVIANSTVQSHIEPLTLDNLTKYQLNDALLDVLIDDANKTNLIEDNLTQLTKTSQLEQFSQLQQLLYEMHLPAGVARQTTFMKAKTDLLTQLQIFSEQLIEQGVFTAIEAAIDVDKDKIDANILQTIAHMSTTQEESIHLAGITLKSQVPVIHTCSSWLKIEAAGASPKHLLRFWLTHLFWQIQRQTTLVQAADNDGRSIWRFGKGMDLKYKNAHAQQKNISSKQPIHTFALPAIKWQHALALLLPWIQLSEIIAKIPIIMPIESAFDYVANCLAAKLENTEYQATMHDFSGWLGTGYQPSQANGDHKITYDRCAQHETWRFILSNALTTGHEPTQQQQAIFNALDDAMSTLAMPLLESLFESLEPIP